MRIDLFRMERTQCLYENEVEYNLSESGVVPMRVDELLEGSPGPEWLRQARLKYPPSRGTDTLRDRIALFYGGGVTRDHVMVTNGGSEAKVAGAGRSTSADSSARSRGGRRSSWSRTRTIRPGRS